MSSVFLSGQKVRLLEQPVTLPCPKNQLSLHSLLEILHPVPDSNIQTRTVSCIQSNCTSKKQLKCCLQYSFDIILRIAASSAKLTTWLFPQQIVAYQLLPLEVQRCHCWLIRPLQMRPTRATYLSLVSITKNTNVSINLYCRELCLHHLYSYAFFSITFIK